MLPEASASLCEAYRKATQNPDGYVILDFAQDTDDLQLNRTNVFPSEYPPIIYAQVKDEADKIFHHLPVLKTAKPQLRKPSLKIVTANS